MENMVKVSVIVPVYNEEKHLRETNEYITNQTLRDIEVIYIDDGSTDETPNILEEIKNKDSRIKVLKQKNLYAGVARNKGIAEAKGQYIVFWDSDDIFHEDALEKMYNKCQQDQADICFCKANHYDVISDRVLKTSTYLKEEMLPEKIPFGREDIDQYIFNFSTNVPWNKMYRKDFIIENKLQFQGIRQANDNYFSMMSYYYAKTFTVVKEELIDYRINYATSLTGKASETPLCVYEAFSKTYEELKNKPDFDRIKQSFYNKTIRSLFYFLSKQTDFDAYKKLYDTYKEKVFKEWEFPKKKDFYYDEKDFDRLRSLRKSDVQGFLLSEYKKSFDNSKIIKDIRKRQKADIKELKEQLKEVKAENKKLKAANCKLEKELKKATSGISYKIGKFITFIPRKIRQVLTGRK